MKRKTVAIIGAGASGLASAVFAARAGAEVSVFEKNPAPAKKILASGAGRCNLTNRFVSPKRYHGGNPEFIRSAVCAFPSAKAVQFFAELGLVLAEERDGRIFPRSMKAQSVAEVLENALKRLRVRIFHSTEIVSVSKASGDFILKDKNGGVFRAGKAVLACGGAGYPQLGGGQSGYKLASLLGHTVTKITPSLVPLCVKEPFVKRMQGIRAQVSLKILEEGVHAFSRGEILFTAYGVSGPAVLDISRTAALRLEKGMALCSMDIFPEFSISELKQLFMKRCGLAPGVSWREFFAGLLERKIASELISSAGLAPDRCADERSAAQLAHTAKDWRFEIAGARPWNEAMISAGGVSLDEVNQGDFQSKKIPGLYITGELLDVDGDSGGFNLHFAWASGFSAGSSAGR